MVFNNFSTWRFKMIISIFLNAVSSKLNSIYKINRSKYYQHHIEIGSQKQIEKDTTEDLKMKITRYEIRIW